MPATRDSNFSHNNADDLDEDLSIRGEYERLGPVLYYQRHGHTYRNPHEPIIADALHEAIELWKPDLSSVLDLAAGSGEVTLVLKAAGGSAVAGIDPYTHQAYKRRTGQPAERMSFEAIAAGSLVERRYSLIVCSFAMHLCDESRLPQLAMQLAIIAPQLWIATPHKRPHLHDSWGWTLEDEFVLDRVRVRNHKSTLFLPA